MMIESKTAVIRVLFLGPLRDRLGRGSAEIPCPLNGAQSAFWAALREHFPVLDSQAGTLRIARESEFLDGSESLCPGDELALIPPVSGG